MQRRIFLGGSLAAATLGLPVLARSQTTGSPLRIIVPTPAGGTSDAAARALANAIGAAEGHPVFVENRPGGGGAVGAQALLAAPADGNTLLWTLASMSGLPWVLKAPPYRALLDLAPVTNVGHLEYALFVSPEIPAETVRDLVAQARQRPQPLAYATGSLGDFMATTRFLREAGISATRVAYRGGSQLMPDLLAGRVQFNFGPLANGLEHVKAGKLRALAVLGPQRSALAPALPTMTEAGYPDASLPTWQALFAPRPTPPSVLERHERTITAVISQRPLASQFEAMGIRADATGAVRLAELARRTGDLWQGFVREYDIVPE